MRDDVVICHQISHVLELANDAVHVWQNLLLDSLLSRRSNLAAFAGVSLKSSGFDTNLSTLRNHARGPFVEYVLGGKVKLTRLGHAQAQSTEQKITSQADLVDAWCRHLSNPQGELLRILLNFHPGAMSRSLLAREAGVGDKSSGFDKNLSTMPSLGLIDYGPGRTVFTTELLFPEGLA